MHVRLCLSGWGGSLRNYNESSTLRFRRFGIAPDVLLYQKCPHLALSHAAAAWVFGITAVDGVAYAAALLVLMTVGVTAAWLPARRASRIDPVITLRCD